MKSGCSFRIHWIEIILEHTESDTLQIETTINHRQIVFFHQTHILVSKNNRSKFFFSRLIRPFLK